MPESVSKPSLAESLHPVEDGFVRFFVHLAITVGLPRSVGEIFGLLFASTAPVSFDEVVARLGISKGSASQGLRLLTQIGAVSQVYVHGDRRTFYLAETRMRQLFSKALQESLRPHLEGNRRFVGLLEETIEESAASLGPAADRYPPGPPRSGSGTKRRSPSSLCLIISSPPACSLSAFSSRQI
jgi:DNA-binding transcriptional regulator GbsR (MarR family)